MPENDNKVDRRSVLRGMSTAAMSVSIVGTATAKAARDAEPAEPDAFRQFAADLSNDVDASAHPDLMEQYADAASVKAAFRGDADPILEALAAEGYLESASLSAFEFGDVEFDTELTPSEAATAASVTAVEHDEEGASAHLMATTESADHRVALYRQPEYDLTYAVVESDDGGTFVHDAGDDVSTSGYCTWDRKYCNTNSICSTYPTTCTAQEAYCCYDSNLNETCHDTRYVCDCSC